MGNFEYKVIDLNDEFHQPIRLRSLPYLLFKPKEDMTPWETGTLKYRTKEGLELVVSIRSQGFYDKDRLHCVVICVDSFTITSLPLPVLTLPTTQSSPHPTLHNTITSPHDTTTPSTQKDSTSKKEEDDLLACWQIGEDEEPSPTHSPFLPFM